MEHIGIAADGCTKVRVGSLLPLVLKQGAVDVAQSHCCHPT